MSGSFDRQEKREAYKIAVFMVVVLILLTMATWLMVPLLVSFVEVYLSPGLGLRDAAVIAFFLNVVLLVVLAVAAGDGLLGEIQFMIGSFVGFFLLLWIAIAWIF